MRASWLLFSTILAGCLCYSSLANAKRHKEELSNGRWEYADNNDDDSHWKRRHSSASSSSGGHSRAHHMRQRAEAVAAAAEETDEKALKLKRAAIAKKNCLNKEIINPALPADKQLEAQEKIKLPFLTKCLSEMILSLSSKESFNLECCVLDLFRLFDQCKDVATTPRPGGGGGGGSDDDDKSTTTTTSTTKAPDTTAKKGKANRKAHWPQSLLPDKIKDDDDDDKKEKKDSSTTTTTTTTTKQPDKDKKKKDKKKKEDEDDRR